MPANRFAALALVVLAAVLATLGLLLAPETRADHVRVGAFARAANLGGDRLNIRACAGLGCRVIGAIPEGQATYVRGEAVYANGQWWYPHDFRGILGYSAGKYLLGALDRGTAPRTNQSAPARPTEPAASPAAAKLARAALSYVGRPTRWGGNTPAGWDCSGFTQYLFKQQGVSLPHNSAAQWQLGTPVARGDLRAGDLVFFANTFERGISHVGVYVGAGQMVSGQSEQIGTAVANVFDVYWGQHYAGARRYL